MAAFFVSNKVDGLGPEVFRPTKKGHSMIKTCIGCNRFKKYECGQVITQRPTSSSARYMSVPDQRCKKNSSNEKQRCDTT